MSRATHIALALAIVVFGAASAASASIITFDKDTQGHGNKGAGFRPVDSQGGSANFVVTARTAIDEAAPFTSEATGDAGTVYQQKPGGNDAMRGLGVQTADAGGSKGISGGGGDANEELIFTYDTAVRLDSIVLGLADIDFGSGSGDKDDPVIFLQLSGGSVFGVTLTESAIQSAFTRTGSKVGTVDFGGFASDPGLSADTAITAFKVREVTGHTYVSSVTTGQGIPEPATLSLVAIGVVGLIARRKRK